MNRFRVSLPLVAALIGVVIFGAPNQARAGYSVRVYDDGVLQGGISVIVVGNSLLFGGATTNFSITSGNGTSNNPGTPSSSNLSLSSNEQISTTFGVTGGMHTIRIELSQNGWAAPVGTPLQLSSSAGGSYVGTKTGNSVSSTYQGFLDPSNTLFGMSAGTALQSASAAANPPLTSPLVYSPGTATSLVPGGTPFALTDVLEFTFTITAGSGQDTANASVSTVASPSPAPAPAGIILAMTAAPFLGIGTWLRGRRKAI